MTGKTITPATQAALDQCREVARAMVKLGRSGTIIEISQHTALDYYTVKRRLLACSTGHPLASSGFGRLYEYDKASKTWGLTDKGRELAKGK